MKALAAARYVFVCGLLAAAVWGCEQEADLDDDAALDNDAAFQNEVGFEEERAQDTDPIVIVDPEAIDVDGAAGPSPNMNQPPEAPSGIGNRGANQPAMGDVDQGGLEPGDTMEPTGDAPEAAAGGGDVVDAPDIDIPLEPGEIEVPEPDTTQSETETSQLVWPNRLRTQLARLPAA